MIVEADALLYAEDDTSPHHQLTLSWLTEALNGQMRIGLPWSSLLAFVRIRTHPRAYERPLDAARRGIGCLIGWPRRPPGFLCLPIGMPRCSGGSCAATGWSPTLA